MLLSETIKREIDFLGKPYANEELKSAVTYEIDSLIYEVTRVFDYYKNRAKRSIRVIYLSGGGSLLPGLKDYMQHHTSIPVYQASDLVVNLKNNRNISDKGFAFLLNAYAATFREGS
jgi:Tfp pilus assembly PilM family ATPase